MTELESLFSAATPNSNNDKGKSNRRSGQKPDKVQIVCFSFQFYSHLSSTKLLVRSVLSSS